MLVVLSLRRVSLSRTTEASLIAHKLASLLTRTPFGRHVVEALRPYYHRLDPWTGLSGLDRRLVAYLPREPGFFVEAGANDGVRQSNTYYLEQRRGWRGLLIEPVPRLAARCHRNRPLATVVNTALVGPENHGKLIAMEDIDLMSIVHGARGSTAMDEAHLVDGETVQGLKRQPLSVIGQTLSSVVDQAGLPRIDLLSLDVEGYELNVLRGLDLSRHAPQWVLVETAQPRRVGDLLGRHYHAVGCLSHHDWLYAMRP
jgi:FkbM family methyltransferase